MEDGEADEAEQKEGNEDIDKSLVLGSLPLCLDECSSASSSSKGCERACFSFFFFLFLALTYTHEAGISASTAEVTEDAELLLLLVLLEEANVDDSLGPKRPPVGLRTRRRRAPGSSTFLFSMAVCRLSCVIVWTSVAMARPLGCCAAG